MIRVALFGGQVVAQVEGGVWKAPPGVGTLIDATVLDAEAQREDAGAYLPDRDRWLADAVAARLDGRVLDDPPVPPAPAGTVF